MSTQPIHFHAPLPTSTERHPLAEALKRHMDGEVYFDRAARGRYATDASIYQILPIGVVVPRTMDAAISALQIAAEQGVPILPRGGGTSQCGQTVGAALVIDNSKFLNRLVHVDAASREAVVEPGMVLDHLNAQLKSTGLWYPVDVSTSAQATLGGMAGNNSCGSRSIAYGNMVDNVLGIDAWLSGNEQFHFGVTAADSRNSPIHGRFQAIAEGLRALYAREADEIRDKFFPIARRVAGYNLDRLAPEKWNLAHLLVGSEGTLGYFKQLHLKLSPLPAHKTLGVCHFRRFYDGMDAAQHIVKLAPSAVELVDRTMLDLSRKLSMYKPTVDAFLRGEPDCVLLVEFSGETKEPLVAKLRALAELMGDLGHHDSVVEIVDANLQKAVWEVRKAGLNIMMSMRGDGKPVSFIEDCAVPLPHLAEYTRRLTEVFHKHGTEGTWYAHASVGCLHVRPILNMKTDGAVKMRAIAEEAAALVREYKGAYSGEHGDGLVRSEWIAPFFGERLTRALGEVKALFDPKGLMNPGKIVSPSKQDDRALFRYAPGYQTQKVATVLNWSDTHGFAGAVEMCNNNGTCRKFDVGTMCPSYRVTRDEQHATRGRANTLRLALSGQLAGGDALASAEVRDALALCVGCKGCKRECPTGVDMAKMKIEATHHYKRQHGHSLRDQLVAQLPHYAPRLARFAWLLNAMERVPGVSALREKLVGFSAQRSLPTWSRQPFLRSLSSGTRGEESERDVLLFADTFNNAFEPENLHAARQVLESAGYRVQVARSGEARPLCCGRTFLATGMVDKAKREAARTLAALKPYLSRGVPVIGLEPSCLLTLRDEWLAMDLGAEAEQLAANAFLLEEFLVREHAAGRFELPLQPLTAEQTTPVFVHGHCHQKALGAFTPTLQVLTWIPGAKVTPIESSCCGMAGAFGFEAEHIAVSEAMGELSLLPAVRAVAEGAIIVADGTSCRHQVHDGAGREAVHVARILARALRRDG